MPAYTTYSDHDLVVLIRDQPEKLLLRAGRNNICRACYATVPVGQESSHLTKVHKVNKDVTLDVLKDMLCLVCCRSKTSDPRNVITAATHAEGKPHRDCLRRHDGGLLCETCGAWVPSSEIKHHARTHTLARIPPLSKDYGKHRAAEKQTGTEYRAEARNSRDKSVQNEPKAMERVAMFLVEGSTKMGNRIHSRPLCVHHFKEATQRDSATPVLTLKRRIVEDQCALCAQLDRYGITQPKRQAAVWSINLSVYEEALTMPTRDDEDGDIIDDPNTADMSEPAQGASAVQTEEVEEEADDEYYEFANEEPARPDPPKTWGQIAEQGSTAQEDGDSEATDDGELN